MKLSCIQLKGYDGELEHFDLCITDAEEIDPVMKALAPIFEKGSTK